MDRYLNFEGLKNKKTFSLSKIPDAYLLLPSQGRSNVHQLNAMGEHVNMLANSVDEADLNEKWGKLGFDELLEMLGPSGWESFCCAYLMYEKNFMLTGLSVGRTLSVFDIVGRDRDTRRRIVGQCKKYSYSVKIPESFRELCESTGGTVDAYFFAFGGCTDTINGFTIFDRTDAREWGQTENGREYRQIVIGES